MNLEPCTHHGRTPPCADALIAAGVAPGRDRDARSLTDRSAAAASRGCARPGVAVDVAGGDVEVARPPPERRGGSSLALRSRPHVTSRWRPASTAASRGAGRPALDLVDREPARACTSCARRPDAVAVGIGTALADDPLLTARDVDPPAERQPLRVVFDRAARLPLGLAARPQCRAGRAGARRGRAGAAALTAAGGARCCRSPASPRRSPLLGRRRICVRCCSRAARRSRRPFSTPGLIDRVMLFTRADRARRGAPALFTRRGASCPRRWSVDLMRGRGYPDRERASGAAEQMFTGIVRRSGRSRRSRRRRAGAALQVSAAEIAAGCRAWATRWRVNGCCLTAVAIDGRRLRRRRRGRDAAAHHARRPARRATA